MISNSCIVQCPLDTEVYRSAFMDILLSHTVDSIHTFHSKLASLCTKTKEKHKIDKFYANMIHGLCYAIFYGDNIHIIHENNMQYWFWHLSRLDRDRYGIFCNDIQKICQSYKYIKPNGYMKRIIDSLFWVVKQLLIIQVPQVQDCISILIQQLPFISQTLHQNHAIHYFIQKEASYIDQEIIFRYIFLNYTYSISFFQSVFLHNFLLHLSSPSNLSLSFKGRDIYLFLYPIISNPDFQQYNKIISQYISLPSPISLCSSLLSPSLLSLLIFLINDAPYNELHYYHAMFASKYPLSSLSLYIIRYLCHLPYQSSFIFLLSFLLNSFPSLDNYLSLFIDIIFFDIHDDIESISLPLTYLSSSNEYIRTKIQESFTIMLDRHPQCQENIKRCSLISPPLQSFIQSFKI